MAKESFVTLKLPNTLAYGKLADSKKADFAAFGILQFHPTNLDFVAQSQLGGAIPIGLHRLDVDGAHFLFLGELKDNITTRSYCRIWTRNAERSLLELQA